MKNSQPVLTIMAIVLSVCMFCACLESEKPSDSLIAEMLLKTCNLSKNDEKILRKFIGITNSSSGSVVSIIKINDESIKQVKTSALGGEMKMKRVKAKYKYKKPESYEAQQGWTFKGEFDTSQESFNYSTPISFEAGKGADSGDSSQISQQFTPTKVSKNGKSCKSKFKYYPIKASKNGKTPRSSGHHSSYGSFSARIKKGKLRYVYNIKKANEGGVMNNMGFSFIKNFWDNVAGGDSNKVEGSTEMHTQFKIGPDDKRVNSLIKGKATKKRAWGKVKSTEQL